MTNVAATAQSFSSAEGRLILSLVNRLGEKVRYASADNLSRSLSLSLALGVGIFELCASRVGF